MQVEEIIGKHPDVQGNTPERLSRCIAECYECAQTCTSCADACLAEGEVATLRQCIRVALDCADICAATGSMASRFTGTNVKVLRVVIQACEQACRTCGEECQKHAGQFGHCQTCAESCIRCADACSVAMTDGSFSGG